MKRPSFVRLTIFALATLIVAAGSARADAVLYVTNFNGNTITAYDATTGSFLGTPVTGGAEGSGFNGIAIDSAGVFLVTAQISNNILRYGPTGMFQSIVDPANAAGLDSPQDLTIGPDGFLYVVSSADDRILRYDLATGDFVDTFANLSGLGHVGPIDLSFGPDGDLYVTGFDDDKIVRIDGQTGAVLDTTQGPAGMSFAAAAFGPDGLLYAELLDPITFLGGIYRFSPITKALDPFIPEGAGGLETPGAIGFGPGGRLLVANLVLDQDFNDIGSTILAFDGLTGAPIGTLVGAGNGLNVPFFMTVVETPTPPVPEPSTLALVGIGLVSVGRGMTRKARRG